MMGLFLIDLRRLFLIHVRVRQNPGISDCGHGLWAGRMHRLQQQGEWQGRDGQGKWL